ncbi:MAG: DUF4382 domain-containing protein [Gemmatimonadota bacterium]
MSLRARLLPILVLPMLAFAACDSDGTSTLDDGPTRLSVYLTDAPGDVAAVWVDVAEIYFQGGPGGRTSVLEEPTGLIELTALADETRLLVGDLQLDPGIYRQLRLVLRAAVLEATDGQVYAFGGAEHPDGLPVTGDLQCPSCSGSGLKIKLAGDAVELTEGGNAVVLDFDVSQSFGHAAGRSGKWIMSPVIHAVRTPDSDDPEAPDAGGSIVGTVVLAQDEAGSPVQIPQCPEGTDRSLADFVPAAVALTLADGDGSPIVRTGVVGEGSAFRIAPLDPDTYTLGVQNLELDAFTLEWTATVEPGEVSVGEGERVEGVVYTVTGAGCVAR